MHKLLSYIVDIKESYLIENWAEKEPMYKKSNQNIWHDISPWLSSQIQLQVDPNTYHQTGEPGHDQ